MTRSIILSYLFSGLLSLYLIVPAAGAAVTLDASPASVAQSSPVTATWSGIVNPSPTDWIGLYTAGSTGSFWDWIYVSCSTNAGSAAASGACAFVIPFSLQNGSYELRLFANNGNTRLATSNQFSVGPNSLPAVTVAATDNAATEGTPADAGVFTVSRTGSTTAALTVNYGISGTATNGTDYQNLTGSVVIPIGQSTAPITVTTIDDATAEGSETVIVTLSSNAAYTVGTPASATVTIADDEPPLPLVTIAATDNAATEGTPADTGVFTVSRTGPTTAPLTVNYTISGTATNGTDYQTLSGSVVISVGQSSAPITVTTTNDALAEGSETVIVTLSANAAYAVGSPASATVTIADDEPAAGPSIAASPANVAQTSLVTATWSGIVNPSATDWIGLYTVGSTGSNWEWVYVSCSKQAGSAAAAGTCSFVVPFGTPNGNYELRLLANNGNNRLATSNQFTVAPSSLPLVTIAATDNAATEGTPADTGVFTVSRTGSTTAALTVNYTIAGTATNGLDYQNLSGSVTIPINASSATITVTTSDDAAAEGSETVIVTLSSNAAYTVGTPASATVTIADDEPPLPAVTIVATDNTATEGTPADTGVFTVSRTGLTTAPLTVNYAVSGTATNGSDYQNLSGSVTIPISSSSATITVTTTNDALAEGSETVIVTLSANAAYAVGSPASATVTIADDEPAAGPSIAASPANVAQTSLVTATWSGIVNPSATDWIGLYTVGSTGSNWEWVYVSCSKQAGSAAAAGTCSFVVPFGTPNGSYELRLLANNGNNRLATSNQFTVGPVSLPAVTIAATDNTATEGTPADTGVFTVSRTGSTTAALTVNYTIAGTATNGTDYQNLTGSVVIPIGQSTAPITVTTIDDATAEGSETVIVTLSSNAAYTVGTPASATVTIADDEPPLPVVTIVATDNTATEGTPADTGVFTVSRTGLTTAPLTVNYAVSGTATNGTDYQTLSGSVIIPVGQSSAPITVTTSNDALVEGSETVIVTLSADAAYSIGTPASATVTIADDEPPLPVVTIAVTDTTATEGTPSDTGVFTVSRTGLTTAPLTVNYTVSGTATNGTDYQTLSGSVIISVGQSSAPITVTTSDDGAVEGSETVIVTLSANANYTLGGTVSGTVTIADNDVPAGPSIAANPAGAAAGSTLTASWSGIASPAAANWIGMYSPGAPDNNSYKYWMYVSCSQTPGASGSASGSCPFAIPAGTTTGSYELRFYSNGYTRLATTQFAVAPVSIVTNSLPDGTLNFAYNRTLAASGGSGVYTWSVVAGALPSGLTLSSSGIISGTPTAAATASFSVRARDSLLAEATKALTLKIDATLAQVNITTDSLPSRQVSALYNEALSASGGTPPYTFSLLSGFLPKGLSLAADGTIAGTPYELGTSTFTVRAQDSQNQTDTQSYMQTILVTPEVLRFLGYWSFDDGTAIDDSGMRYDGTLVGNPTVVPGIRGQALNFDGAGQHVNFGPVLDPGSGHLSVFAWVKTTAIGSAQMIVSKRDSSLPGNPGYQLFQNSSGRLAFSFGNINLNTDAVRVDSTGPQINDGNWHFVGVVFRRSGNGVLYVDGVPAPGGSGDITPEDGNNANNLVLRIGAEDGGHFWNGAIDEVRIFDRRIFTPQQVLDMYNQSLSIIADSLPVGAINTAYSQTLTGSGGSLPYTWSIASGSLPSGLSLAPNGVLSGTPTANGTFNFTLRLDDPALHTTTQAFSLAITGSAPQILLTDNFAGTLANWTIFDEPAPGPLGCDAPPNCGGPSAWVITNGDLIQQSNFNTGSFAASDPVKPGTYAYAGGAAWQDYTFSLRLMSEDNDSLGVMFRFQDGQNYYRFSMDTEGSYRRLVKMVNGATTVLAQDAIPYEIGHSYNLRVSVVANRIRIYLDNKLIFDVLDSSLATGKIALYAWGDLYAHFGDVLVTNP